MSGVSGAALWEVSCINRSLSALSDVLGALAEQRPHVPYRNSRLTHLLQDVIGDTHKHTHTPLFFMTYDSCSHDSFNTTMSSSSWEIPHVNIHVRMPTHWVTQNIHLRYAGKYICSCPQMTKKQQLPMHVIKSVSSFFIFSTRWQRQAAADAVRLSHAALHHWVSAVSGLGHAGPSGPEGATTTEE